MLMRILAHCPVAYLELGRDREFDPSRVQDGLPWPVTSYGDFFEEKANVGYEALLYDCMLNDATLFSVPTVQRRHGVRGGVLHTQSDALPIYGYQAGSHGPREANSLLEKDGRAWKSLLEH